MLSYALTTIVELAVLQLYTGTTHQHVVKYYNLSLWESCRYIADYTMNICIWAGQLSTIYTIIISYFMLDIAQDMQLFSLNDATEWYHPLPYFACSYTLHR